MSRKRLRFFGLSPSNLGASLDRGAGIVLVADIFPLVLWFGDRGNGGFGSNEVVLGFVEVTGALEIGDLVLGRFLCVSKFASTRCATRSRIGLLGAEVFDLLEIAG